MRSTTVQLSPPADELRHAIMVRIAPVVRACGLGEHEVTCRLVGDVQRLRVEIVGPAALRSVEQALGVRVLDAVHAHGSTIGAVSVVLVT